jgi:hypothetical protein
VGVVDASTLSQVPPIRNLAQTGGQCWELHPLESSAFRGSLLRQPSSGSRFGGILVGIAMNNNRERDQWLQDVEARQRNVVFSNTVQNEARFWRNSSKQPFTTSTKVVLGVLGVFVYGFLITILVAAFRAGVGWRLAVGMILFCGPLFGAIAWAARRSLRNIDNARHRPHNRKH